jgi:predicted nuclease of restriction endonuclease-like (RecB) superfamily
MAAELVLPVDYALLLSDLKTRIREAQTRAALSVNRELVLLYWQIGNVILDKQAQAGWGAKVVSQLSGDLKTEFPEMKGFSPRNLKYMQQFARTWTDVEFVQQVAAQLPWFHNCVLLEKISDPNQRVWYAQATIQHGWSRNVLVHQIDSRLFERKGKAITNFERTLPAEQSELTQQLLKDPYNFDFLSLGAEALERDLERGLLAHLKDFMLELGVGFAFVGSQYHLELSDEDVYIDLLFYHLKLRAFVVIELKAREVQPADVAQVMAYVAIVDEKLRYATDASTIGLVLGKGKKAMAEYVLRSVNAPIGIAEYITADALPKNLEADLPSVEQLEAELARLGEADE